MTATTGGATGSRQGAVSKGVRQPWPRVSSVLSPLRPRFRDWRFWVVQGLVGLVAGLHYYAHITDTLGYAPGAIAISFIQVSLFFIPTVYAALNFGLAGTIGTAFLSFVITMPATILLHHGIGRIAELTNLLIVLAVALFVGSRVDRETSARRRAEAAGVALGMSEAKYRGLFQSSPVAILLLTPVGRVLEGNPASGKMFAMPSEDLKDKTLTDLLGTEDAQRLLQRQQEEATGQVEIMMLRLRPGADIWVEPKVTFTADESGRAVVQLLLRDVTLERRRQAGLKAYAAGVQKAQEDERTRIAHELHDDVVQSLVLLCRDLDSAESEAANCEPQATMVEAKGGKAKAVSRSEEGSVAQRVRDARKVAEDIMARLRAFARDLRPPSLEDLGLVVAVNRILADMSDRTGIEGQLKVEGVERRLPRDTELGLFRIAQEALRNVESHSQATKATVTVVFAGKGVSLEVSDNGAGFIPPPDLRDLAAGGHLGLLGLKERADLLGGELRVSSRPRGGVAIRVFVPEVEGLPAGATARQ